MGRRTPVRSPSVTSIAAAVVIVSSSASRCISATTIDSNGVVNRPRGPLKHDSQFQSFIERFSKRYCGDDARSDTVCEISLKTQTVYLKNIESYIAHNSMMDKTYEVRETRWSDLTVEGFARSRLTYAPRKGRVDEASLGWESWSSGSMTSLIAMEPEETAALAAAAESFVNIENFSWRHPPTGYGDVVGKVHDQQNMCASCWAFVTADSIASRVAVINKGDDATPLSVKHLMACDDVDHACSTGNMYTAYEWLSETGGIATKADYDKEVPGEREDDPEAQCSTDVPKMYTTPAMCDLKQTAGEMALMNALYNRGPVAVGINANLLMSYSNGVIMAKDCPPLGEGIYSINHAALVVGWGVDASGIKYWELKNSYGPDWGDQGFFRLERGKVNDRLFGTCGLLFESVFPIVTKPGESVNEDAPCTPGSVRKESYYHDLTDNPGVSATTTMGSDTNITPSIGIPKLNDVQFGAAEAHLSLLETPNAAFAIPVAGVAFVAVIAFAAKRISNRLRGTSEESEVLLNV